MISNSEKIVVNHKKNSIESFCSILTEDKNIYCCNIIEGTFIIYFRR
jgi:hypothetical protein